MRNLVKKSTAAPLASYPRRGVSQVESSTFPQVLRSSQTTARALATAIDKGCETTVSFSSARICSSNAPPKRISRQWHANLANRHLARMDLI